MSQSNEEAVPESNAPRCRKARSRRTTVLTILGGIIAASALWYIAGRDLPAEYQRWRAEARAAQDNQAVGYVGLNYRRSYNDRPLVFLTTKDGRTTLFAAKGEGGAPPAVYDVTDSAIDMNVLEGGFGRDSIPGIDYPLIENADGPRAQNLPDRRDVFGLELTAGARAYPRDLLEKIEVVNDRDGETSFVVIFDRSRAKAFAYRRADSSFGTTGYSRTRQPVLYDRKTGGLWVFEGDDFVCVNGPLKGTKLEPYRTPVLAAWSDWLAGHRGTQVVVGNDRKQPIPAE